MCNTSAASCKSSSKLLVIGSLGTLQKVDGGSYHTALLGSRSRDTMKDKNSRAYCVHTSVYTVQGLSFEVENYPPMTLV